MVVRSIRGFVLAALLLGSGAWAGWMPAARAADPPRPYVGIADDESLAERPEGYDDFARLGVTLQRIEVRWPDVVRRMQPSAPSHPMDPAYDWAWLDLMLGNARDRGVDVMLTVWRAPTWATRTESTFELPADAATYRDFLVAVLRHADVIAPGVVRFVEVWNEPNISIFGGPQGRPGPTGVPERYAVLVEAAHQALAETGIPGIRLVAGSLGQASTSDENSLLPLDFLRRMRLPNGAVPRFDVLSVHPYPGSRRPGFRPRRPTSANVDLGDLPAFLEQVPSAVGDKPVIASEFGIPTAPNILAPVWFRQREQGDRLREAMAMLAGMHLLGVVYYQLVDQVATFDAEGNRTSWSSGLRAWDGTPKSGLAAFADGAKAVAAGRPLLARHRSRRVRARRSPAR
jgi:hypothetical protein